MWNGEFGEKRLVPKTRKTIYKCLILLVNVTVNQGSERLKQYNMFTRKIVREIVRDVRAGTGLVQLLIQWRSSVLAV